MKWLMIILLIGFLGMPIQADEVTFTAPSLILGRGSIRHIVFHPTGDQVAISSETGLWIYTYPDLADVHHIPTIISSEFGWSSDGRYFAVEAFEIEHDFATTSFIWDTRTWDLHYTTQEWVGGVDWSAEGHYIATGNRDHDIIIWDAKTNTPHQQMQRDGANARFVRWSADESALLMHSATSAQIWDVASGSLIREFPYEGTHNIVAWSSDSRRIALIQNEITVVYDVQTGERLFTLPIGIHESARARWSPDDRYLITENWYGMSRAWDMTRGELAYPLSTNGDWHQGFMWSSDGALLAIGIKNTVQLLDSTTRLMQQSFTIMDTKEITTVVIHPDDESVLIVGDSGIITIWDLSQDEMITQYYQHLSYVMDMAWSPDSQHMAIGGERIVTIWNTQTGDLERMMRGNTDTINAVRWSPDGSCLLSTSDNETIIWRVNSGEVVYQEPTDWRWYWYAWYDFIAWSGGTSCLMRDKYDNLTLINPSLADFIQALGRQHLLWDIRQHPIDNDMVIVSYTCDCRGFERGTSLMQLSTGGTITSVPRPTDDYDLHSPSSDGTRYILAHSWDEVVIWDNITQTVITQLTVINDGEKKSVDIHRIDWSHDDAYVLVMNEYRTYVDIITIWETTVWQQIMMVRKPFGGGYGITQWSPDSSSLAQNGYGLVHIWVMPEG